jgi:hypothetical protein
MLPGEPSAVMRLRRLRCGGAAVSRFLVVNPPPERFAVVVATRFIVVVVRRLRCGGAAEYRASSSSIPPPERFAVVVAR